MRILVTGSSGYVGSYVCEELTKRGHIVVNFHHRFENEITENLFELYGKPDKLIHCAWSGLPNYTSIDHYNNVESHYKFIQHLVSQGLNDITAIGTCFENLDKPNHYSLAKIQLRKKLEQLPINFKWAQLFYVYGGNDKPYNLLQVIRKAVNTGKKTFSIADVDRDFIHVKNAANSICDIALQSKVTGVIEVGTGVAIPVIDLAKRYFHEIEFVKDYPVPDYEPKIICANIVKLNSL